MALIDTLLSSKRFTLKAADLSCGLKINTFQLVPAALCIFFSLSWTCTCLDKNSRDRKGINPLRLNQKLRYSETARA